MKAERVCVRAVQAEAGGRGLDEAQLRMLKAQVRVDEVTAITLRMLQAQPDEPAPSESRHSEISHGSFPFFVLFLQSIPTASMTLMLKAALIPTSHTLDVSCAYEACNHHPLFCHLPVSPPNPVHPPVTDTATCHETTASPYRASVDACVREAGIRHGAAARRPPLRRHPRRLRRRWALVDVLLIRCAARGDVHCGLVATRDAVPRQKPQKVRQEPQ